VALPVCAFLKTKAKALLIARQVHHYYTGHCRRGLGQA
jgi:hypothetical protein